MLRPAVALALLIPLLVGPGCAAKSGKAESSAEELYTQGLRAMKNGYYTKALEKFNRVRNYHRDDPLSVKAQLAIADMHFKKGDFEQARFAYEEFASYHPRHPNLDYVTYKIGLSIYRRAPKLAGRDQSATRSAVNVWTGFDTRFADSEHTAEVQKLRERGRNRLAAKELAIARFYADRDAWGAVRGRCEGLVRRYPDSVHVPDALGLLGVALHAWGDTAQATDVRERLFAAAPTSGALHELDRALARPAGEKPDEKVFIRPYRIRGPSMPGGAGTGP